MADKSYELIRVKKKRKSQVPCYPEIFCLACAILPINFFKVRS